MPPLNAPASSPRWLGLSAAIATSITWGLQAIVLKVAIQTIPLISVVWFRFAFALLFLAGFLFWQNPKNLKILRAPPLGTILAGLFLAVNYHTFLLGLQLTSPSNAQVMIQAAPYGLAVFSIFYFKEKTSPISVLGFILTPLGLYLFFRDQFVQAIKGDEIVSGNLWILLSSLAWIIYSVLQKTLSRKYHPNQILLVVFTVTTLLILPFSQAKVMFDWDAFEWTIMLVLGLFTLLAYCSLGFALANAPASQVSIIITCNPLLTIFLMQMIPATNNFGLMTETIQPLGYMGAVMVIGGICLALRQRN